MRVLICDQSLLNFGYCIVEILSDECNVIEYGLLKLNRKIIYLERVNQIKEWLNKTIEEYNIEKIVAEEIQFQKNVQTFKKLSILQYIIEAVCGEKNVIYEKPLHVHTWRTRGIKYLLQLQSGSKQGL